jgi:6-pyruvoyltetrahydropterin/6-carboxytetrahydropterin synthase
MDANKFVSTKHYTGFPCTHRQWRATESHCRYIHGYSREFFFRFACSDLTREGWVVDFGGLKAVKAWLDHIFDHTFRVDEDDPYMDNFVQMEKDGIIQMRVMPNIGMEGTAKYVYEHVNQMIKQSSDNRAWVLSVEVRENEKNSAIYTP